MATKTKTKSVWKMPPPSDVIDVRHPWKCAFYATVNLDVAQSGLQQTAYGNCNPNDLYSKAMAGDGGALEILVKLPIELITILEKIAEEKPSLLQPIAGRRSTWPVVGSRSPRFVKDHKTLFDRIGLAADHQDSFWLDKRIVITNRESIPKKWAFALITFIQALRAGITFLERTQQQIDDELFQPGPRWKDKWTMLLDVWLNTNNAEWILEGQRYTKQIAEEAMALAPFSGQGAVINAWWDIARELLMLNTDGHPECIEELRLIGIGRAKHYSGLTTVKPDLSGRDVYLHRDTNIRAKIFTDLKEESVRFAKQVRRSQSRT
jgi:hypothetical protein